MSKIGRWVERGNAIWVRASVPRQAGPVNAQSHGRLSMLSFIRSLSLIDVATALVDIGVVAYVFYRLLVLIRGTRAIQLIKGVVVLLVATSVSQWLGLRTVQWLLSQITVALVVALPIVFQPELRKALEQLGRGRLFSRSLEELGDEGRKNLIDDVIKAVDRLSRNKTGALLVIERETGLKEYIETGVKIDGIVSSEFLINIFVPNTPLHDGAIILRGNRVAAAGCFLPLTDAPDLSPELGSRHRAGLGITEHSDALALIVSEETGSVSLAHSGKLIRNLDGKTLKEMLSAMIQPKAPTGFQFFGRGTT